MVETAKRVNGCALAFLRPPDWHALPGCPPETGRHALPAEAARAGSVPQTRTVSTEVATERARTKDAAMVVLSKDYDVHRVRGGTVAPHEENAHNSPVAVANQDAAPNVRRPNALDTAPARAAHDPPVTTVMREPGCAPAPQHRPEMGAMPCWDAGRRRVAMHCRRKRHVPATKCGMGPTSSRQPRSVHPPRTRRWLGYPRTTTSSTIGAAPQRHTKRTRTTTPRPRRSGTWQARRLPGACPARSTRCRRERHATPL